MKFRWYQEEAINSLFQYFSVSSGNPLIAMPTGTGKSLVIAGFVHQAASYYPSTRVMMLTHVKELISQNMEKLLTVWPTAPAGIYSAGLKRRDTQYPITFAGIASVHNIANQFGHVDLVIIDEAHLVSPKGTTMYRSFIKKLKAINPFLKVIGLTATPYRLGTGMLNEGGLFTDVCYDITDMQSFNRLVAEGYMSPLITRRTGLSYDLSGIRMQGDDLHQGDLQRALDVDRLTYSAVRETIEYGRNRKQWLIFASGINHVLNIRDCFESFGVPITCVHSEMDDAERDANIKAYKQGKVLAMVNNNMLTTGHDFPGLDLISVMTMTMSPNKWVQMLGRGTRIDPPHKSDCLVLDFGRNTERLGPINDPHIPRKKGKGTGPAPVKFCPECNTYNHASVRECVNCKYVFPMHLKIQEAASTLEVMKGNKPVTEDFKVTKIIYTVHTKEGRPDTLKVTYYCGLRLFTEYVCLEHGGFASKRARDWWRERSPVLPPETVAEAMHHIDTLEEPQRIKVWVNTKHPEIVSHDF